MDGVCAILHQVSSMLYNIGADKSQATDSSGVSQNTALSYVLFKPIGKYLDSPPVCSFPFSSWIATDTEQSGVIMGDSTVS